MALRAIRPLRIKRVEPMGHDETVRIAELYEEHPCLYNVNLASYTDRTRRERAWRSIAEALGKDVDVIKAKVDNLRTQYTREKRKIAKRKSGENPDPLYKARWWLMGKMHFLNDFTHPRIEDSDILKRESDDLTPEEYCEIEMEATDDPDVQHMADLYNDDWASSSTTADTSTTEALQHFHYLSPTSQTPSVAKRHLPVSITPSVDSKRQRLSTGNSIHNSMSPGNINPIDPSNVIQLAMDASLNCGQSIPRRTKNSDERFCDYLCEEFKAMDDEQTKVRLRRNIMNLLYNAQLELHANQNEHKDLSSNSVVPSDDSNSVSASATVTHCNSQGRD